MLLLWLTGELARASATTVAFLGVSMLLVTRVLDWQDVLGEKGAWDALVWFGVLVMLAGQLDKAGLPQAFAQDRPRARQRLAVVVGARCAAGRVYCTRTTRLRAWSRT